MIESIPKQIARTEGQIVYSICGKGAVKALITHGLLLTALDVLQAEPPWPGQLEQAQSLSQMLEGL
jgi:hypothetical protein